MNEELDELLEEVLPLGNLKNILGKKFETYMEINLELNVASYLKKSNPYLYYTIKENLVK